MAKKKTAIGSNMRRKKKKSNRRGTPTKPTKEHQPHYGPNVFIGIPTPDGMVRFGYWQKRVSCIEDVLGVLTLTLSGETLVNKDLMKSLIKVIGKEVEAEVSYAHNGYAPVSARKEVTMTLRKLKVIRNYETRADVAFECGLR